MIAVPVPQATIIGNANQLIEKFERVEGGWIAFKIFNSLHRAPSAWKIEAGSVIYDDHLHRDTEVACSYGINVASNIDWIYRYVDIDCGACDELQNTHTNIWKVLIPDSATIIIPDDSDGKIRVDKIQLLETVGEIWYNTSDGFAPGEGDADQQIYDAPFDDEYDPSDDGYDDDYDDDYDFSDDDDF